MTWIAILRSLSWAFAFRVGGRERQEGTTIGRRDKSGSPFASQVLDRTWLSPCRSVGSRAALRQNINIFNDLSGTVRSFVPSDSPR